MRLIDIIIPQYKENDIVVSRLLRSISKQVNIKFSDIGIIIVNDCSNIKLSKKLFKEFPKLNITYIKNEVNLGPGLTRQNGIDKSDAYYVTFMDADDMYYSNDVLSKIIDIINNQAPDVILTDWYEENKIGSMSKLILHKPDVTWVHGKFIKREYLVNNNFRFNKNIRLHEDSYFSTLLLMNTDNPYYLPTPTYLWKHDKNSLVGKVEKYPYLFRTYKDLMVSIIDLYDELVKRNTPRKEEYIIKSIYYLLFILQSEAFKEIDDLVKNKKKEYEIELYKLISKVKPVINTFNTLELNSFKDRELQSIKEMYPFFNQTESLQEFIFRMGIGGIKNV